MQSTSYPHPRPLSKGEGDDYGYSATLTGLSVVAPLSFGEGPGVRSTKYFSLRLKIATKNCFLVNTTY